MKFTREAWENAPEGARLEYADTLSVKGHEVYLIGYKRTGYPVIEFKNGRIDSACLGNLRIILPKRKVTVQLWRDKDGLLATSTPETLKWVPCDWALLGEHTFEIEGE